jgi:DNA-binding helix-hairpin-helix protein with protein kinase domain
LSPLRLFDDRGATVTLTREIGRGGEGYVAETSDPNLVAKVYLDTVDAEKAAKLSAMQRLASPDLLRVAAWPTKVLHSNGAGGPIVGFLQPRVVEHREIHQLYSPVQRRQYFPETDWAFLLHVAMNCAAGIETVHAAGQVVGDLNQSGILVAKNGMVRLIDCDSFQITTGGSQYRCVVGVPFFTPPELQGMNFRDVDRTQSHDCFGLAVIIFHLMFMGRHPFAGRYVGSGDMTIERAISEGRFAFSRHSSQFQMMPPPHAMPIDALPNELSTLFDRAFALKLNGTPRPSAEEWRLAIAKAKNLLSRCPTDRSHVHFNRLSYCPWCKIEQEGGPAFFTSVAATITFEGEFNLEAVWRRIQAVRRPPGVQALVMPARPKNIVPAPTPTDARWEEISLLPPEPPAPINDAKPLPALPVFEPEVVPDDPVFEPEPLPEIPRFVPDNFVDSVDAKYRKSGNKLLRFLFPGSPEYQIERQLAEKESREYVRKWADRASLTQREREQIPFRNERESNRCAREAQRLAGMRVGLEERNRERYSRWQQEFARIQHLRKQIETDNIAANAKWLQAREVYLARKAAYDQQFKELERRKATRHAERQKRMARLESLSTQIAQISKEWTNSSRALIAEFDHAIGQLAIAKDAYEELRREFDIRKGELQKNERELQLRDYLQSALINEATIPGVGPKRKATLAAYNVETAFDLPEGSLYDLPGFGYQTKWQLYQWRADVVRQFQFDASKGISPVELRSLHMMFHSRRIALQRELLAGEEHLQDVAGRGERRLKELSGQASALIVPLAQAEADVAII